MFSDSRKDILQLIHNGNELLHPLVLRTGATVEGGMMKVHGGLPGHCKLSMHLQELPMFSRTEAENLASKPDRQHRRVRDGTKRLGGQECGTSSGLRPVWPVATLDGDARPSESAFLIIPHKVDKTLRACLEKALDLGPKNFLALFVLWMPKCGRSSVQDPPGQMKAMHLPLFTSKQLLERGATASRRGNKNTP